jgi:hypothetical protein
VAVQFRGRFVTHSCTVDAILQVGLLCSPTEVAAEARAVSSASAWVHGPIIQV